MAGWASNSKYAFLGHYDLPPRCAYLVQGPGIINVLICGLPNLSVIVEAQREMYLPCRYSRCLWCFFLTGGNQPPLRFARRRTGTGRWLLVEYSSMSWRRSSWVNTQYDFDERDDDRSVPGGWLLPVDITLFNMIPNLVYHQNRLVLFALWVRR